MNTWILLACLASQFCLAGGQICLKHAMNFTHETPPPWRKFLPIFALGIAVLSGWFFLWVGLLQELKISYVYPFEGLSPVLMVLGAAAFLREKLTVRSCVGMALIAGGVALASLAAP